MKFLLLLIFTLLLGACGNKNCIKDKKETIEDIMRSAPYININDIDSELYGLYDSLRQQSHRDWDSYALERFIDRLEFHLANPLTFLNKLLLTDSLINITTTPDGKYKFYSFEEDYSGNMGCYLTYIQYLDDSGIITFRPWQEKVRFDYTRLYSTIWQFESDNTTYYVAKSYKRGSSRSFYYHMEIFTLTDGVPTFHSEFYPEATFEPHEVRIVDLDSDELEYDIPAYDIVVCFTDFGHNDIGFTFDPKNKTVTLTEYETTFDDSLPIGERKPIHKKVTRSWKLINIE